ncbi:uncharacterized protein PFL1_04107 [Pseudozyma flocculosa PF-1]|uniref:TFIIS central domain-containing protein n=2 Tax=Pseudozyma flocculosa TaxID=84751 RepID=A0A5C3ESV4_9BASI|nr:uncharacterized protein PFL1_04107 [Pseudozyma flocculosa PF-1]EPQ28280.1 hypothetical protein PFL1_04107 [Pseudozyma flocculosa PF-1]SPO35424.1 uncharacterized protein PSFLO_00895 [Pseudozyma flocculosa]
MSEIRTRSAHFLTESLSSASPSSSSSQDLSSLGSDLEAAIHAKHGDTSNEYRAEVRNLGLTLKRDNPQLAASLVQGTVTAEQVAHMSDDELKSPQRRMEDNRLRQQGLENAVGVDDFQIDVTSTTQPGISTADQADMATYGEAEDAEMGGGGEGEFKARAQPKVGEAMKGIEFETGS